MQQGQPAQPTAEPADQAVDREAKVVNLADKKQAGKRKSTGEQKDSFDWN